MIKVCDLPDIAVILLAAGHSRRFGANNKLLAEFRGKPLISAVMATVSSLPCCARIATIGEDIDCDLLPGFETVLSEGGSFSQSDSLKAAMAVAMKHRLDAVLICLGDMPLVPFTHFERIMAKFNGADSLVATQALAKPMPPALFGASWFPNLMALDGDRGARDLIRHATDFVLINDQYAIDIDTISELEQLRQARPLE